MAPHYKHRANNALGAFVICLLFAVETSELESATPNPATPLVRGFLGFAAVVVLALYFLYRKKAREQGQRAVGPAASTQAANQAQKPAP